MAIGNAHTTTEAEPVELGPTRTAYRSNTQRVQNPFIGMTKREVIADAALIAGVHGLNGVMDEFMVGAAVAKATLDSPDGYTKTYQCDDNVRKVLAHERKYPYRALPLTQYLLSALCAGCAIVQGMDQTIINGAQVRDGPDAITKMETHCVPGLLLCRLQCHSPDASRIRQWRSICHRRAQRSSFELVP